MIFAEPPYAEFRKLAGQSLVHLVKRVAKRKISLNDVYRAILEAQDRDELMVMLRSLGLSTGDIATGFGLSRQRVSQIVGTGDVAAPYRPPRRAPLSQVEQAIIQRACHDPDWWNVKQTLKREKVKATFREHGYTKNETNRGLPWRELDFRKARVLLEGLFNVPQSEHRDWVLKEQGGRSQSYVYQLVTSKTPVPLSRMAWCRYCLSLGVPGDRNAPKLERNGQ